jgi:hypothetical protein
MGKFLDAFFTGLVKTGSIEIETASGHEFTLGDGSGPKLGLRFNDKAAPAFLLLDPELNFSEMYMDGRIEVTYGTIFDVLMLNAANMWRPDGSLWVFLLGKMRSALRQTLHGPTLACGTRPCPRGRPPRRRRPAPAKRTKADRHRLCLRRSPGRCCARD